MIVSPINLAFKKSKIEKRIFNSINMYNYIYIYRASYYI